MPPSPADFGQWERLTPAGERGGLSPGRPVAGARSTAPTARTSCASTSVADGTTKTIAFGAQPAFSADSRWLAVSVGVSEAQQDKLRKDKKPIRRKLTLVNLASGEHVDASTASSRSRSAPTASTCCCGTTRRSARRRARRPDPARRSIPRSTAGVTAIVRDLRDGTRHDVRQRRRRRPGRRRAGCSRDRHRRGGSRRQRRAGLRSRGRHAARARLGAARATSGSTWRKDADDLVVLQVEDRRQDATARRTRFSRGRASARSRERKRAVRSGRRYRRSARRGVCRVPPAVVVGGRRHDLRRRRTVVRESGAKTRQGSGRKDAADADDPPTVDVWHPRDVDVMPKQKVGATRDRQRSLLAAWPIDEPAVTVLGQDYYEQVDAARSSATWPTPSAGRGSALGSELGALRRRRRSRWSTWRPASARRSSDRARRSLRPRQSRREVHPLLHRRPVSGRSTPPAATVDATSRSRVATSFIDRESDSTDVQRPWFGVAGWTSRRRATCCSTTSSTSGRWRPNGSKATRLTDGAGGADPSIATPTSIPTSTRSIGRSRSISTCSATGPKKSGIRAARARARRRPRQLVWLDKSVDASGEGEGRRRLRLRRPELRGFARCVRRRRRSEEREAGHGDQRVPEQVRVGPRRARRVQEREGQRLQGVLRYPAGLRAGKKYPMVVYVYEKLSDGAAQLRRAVRARVLQRARRSRAPATSTSSPTSSFVRASPGCRSSNACGPPSQPVVADGASIDPKTRRHDRPLVGRLRHGVHGDAHRHVRRRRRRRADHRSRQQLRQPSLLVGHRRDRSHRDRPAAHAGAALRGSRRPTSRNSAVFTRQHDDDAAADRGGRLRRHGVLAPGRRAATTSRAARRRTSCCSSTAARITACGRRRTRSTTTSGSSTGSGTT
mgnify:CR=1 FL=1